MEVLAYGAVTLCRYSYVSYTHLLDRLPAITYIADVGASGRWHYVSPQIQKILGFSPEEWRARAQLWAESLHPEDREHVLESEAAVVAGVAESTAMEYRLLHRDGHPVWIRDDAVLVGEPDGNLRWHGVMSDITDRKHVEAELEQRVAQQAAVARLGEHALEGAATSSLMQEAVGRAAEILGVEVAGVAEFLSEQAGFVLRSGFGWPESAIGSERTAAGATTQAGATVLSQEPVLVADWATERRFAQSRTLRELGVRSGLAVPIEGSRRPFGILGVQSLQPRAFTAGDIDFLQSLANVLADAIERHVTEDAIRHRALHDPLTELPNRVLFLDRLEQTLARIHRRPSLSAILFLDLDRFKLVNDSLGHHVGDELLAAAAPRIRYAVRGTDTVARFGGDEFAIMVEDIPGERFAIETAERIAAAFAKPFALRGREHFVTASIGIALADGRQSAEELIRDADAAMYRAKERGRARYEMFDELMRGRATARLGVENDLRRALSRDELRLDYQPLVSLSDWGIVGVEALVRWRHPRKGLIWPDDFVPVAEETGMIAPIGRWVLERACVEASRWQALRPDGAPVGVSVNLSALQLADPQLVDLVADTLESSKLEPSCLSLEITESVMLADADLLTDVLASLRSMGVQIVLDDFGTGYSSLTHLTKVPLDAIKVDRSFVDGLGSEPRVTAITEAIIAMAHALKLDVVAEGVETQRQANELRDLGCQLAQGFHFSQPVPARAISEMLVAVPRWRAVA
jgi:diguanylate cyclase (GGDEF)-like protein/PAS domain S-box-containing protein